MTIIVTGMVVGRNEQRSDARVHKELGEDRLELRLPRHEVTPIDEELLALGELDGTRNKRVLRYTVDEGFALEDGSDGKEGEGGTSVCVERIEARRLPAVSFTPGMMSL